MNMRKEKYELGVTSRKKVVDNASRVKQMLLIISDDAIRFGYEAFACSLVRINREPRLVIVAVEMIADWKCVRIQSLDSNRL